MCCGRYLCLLALFLQLAASVESSLRCALVAETRITVCCDPVGAQGLAHGAGEGVDERTGGGPAAAVAGVADGRSVGQDYLPSRPGTAAGVTLGLTVSAGGLFLPVLGIVADAHGPRGAFQVLTVIPVLAVALSTMLREPRPD